MPSNWTCNWCGAENPWPTMTAVGIYTTACPHCEAKYEFERGLRWVSMIRVTDGVRQATGGQQCLN